MADETKTEGTESKAPKAKTVAEDMNARRIFPTIGEAVEYLKASAASFADFASYPVAAPAMDENGNFDSAVYNDKTDTMVALLRRESKVKAIVVAPIPKLDELLTSEAGRAWADKILHKELNHVAVRQLRDAEDVTTVIDQIPTTLDAYITSGREGGGIIESFNESYKLINAALAVVPVWAKARLVKTDLRKAMESKGYALEFFSALENRSDGSLFAKAIALGINFAKRKGLDPTIFERWAATRDAKEYKPGDEDEDEIDLNDLDKLTDSMLAEESKGTETPAPAGDQAAAPATTPPAPPAEGNEQTAEAPPATGDAAAAGNA